LARLAIAIDEDWGDGDAELAVGLDERTSQSVFKGRREPVLFYRHIDRAFVMYLGLGRVAGYAADADRLVWRFADVRRFRTPVISDAERDVPRVRFMLGLAPERFLDIVKQGTEAAADSAVAEAAAAFEGGRRSPETYLAVHDEVLRRWNYRCAVTGRQFSAGARPHPHLDLVEIRPRRLGGPLHAANYLPMVSFAAEGWRKGGISVGQHFDLLAVLDRLAPELLEAMRPEGRLLVPEDPTLWPAAEHLAFHRAYIFGA